MCGCADYLCVCMCVCVCVCVLPTRGVQMLFVCVFFLIEQLKLGCGSDGFCTRVKSAVCVAKSEATQHSNISFYIYSISGRDP